VLLFGIMDVNNE